MEITSDNARKMISLKIRLVGEATYQVSKTFQEYIRTLQRLKGKTEENSLI